MSTSASSKDKLKFREPGIRDTVVKVNSSPAPTYAASTPAQTANNSNPLFTKIRDTLTNSDPSKWEKYGDELNSDTKYPKAHEKWEIAYCIDLPNGLLTFRSTQIVKSEYFGGGYTIKPDGGKAYLTELRPRSWDPRTLIDPFFRSTLEKDKQYKALADGTVAQELFELIEKTFVNFSSQKHRSISDSIQDLANNLIAVAAESNINDWKRDESQEGKVVYTNSLQEISVEIIRQKRLDLFTYSLTLEKGQVKSQIKDPALGKELFTLLDEKSKNAALEALQSVLDEAGF